MNFENTVEILPPVPPTLPSSKQSKLDPFNVFFNMGRVVSLFSSLRLEATKYKIVYKESGHLNLAISHPKRFLSQISRDLLKYTSITKAGKNKWQYKEAISLLGSLPSDSFVVSTLTQAQKACIGLGYVKQEMYNMEMQAYKKLLREKNKTKNASE